MKKRLPILFAITLSIFPLAFLSCSQDPDCTAEESIESIISEYYSRIDAEIPISLAIYSKKSNIDFAISVNVMEKDDPQFYLYSITKTFVSAAIIDLCNKGRMSFDDKLSKYFDYSEIGSINASATIGELLSHRSGIADYATTNSLLLGLNSFRYMEWNPSVVLSLVKTPYDKNKSYIYSSTNYILLGMILEQVTGCTANEWLKSKLYTPLALKFALVPQDTVDYSLLEHPHIFPNTEPLWIQGDENKPVDVTDFISDGMELIGKVSWTSGGMVGTAKQTAKWGYNLLSDNGLVADEIRHTMYQSIEKIDETNEYYGYGVRKLFDNGDDGIEVVGSYGRGVGSDNLMFYDSEYDICIAILTGCNKNKNGTPDIEKLLFDILKYERREILAHQFD